MSTDEPGSKPESVPRGDWTEKQLPPVKPPTAGLLMQLFFIPMMIVSIIVAVWLMFGWLAQSGASPRRRAENLKRMNKGSWQDAHSLSNLLRDPRETDLRNDTELAQSLADTLTALLDENPDQADQQRHKLAVWLCRALGEFEVDTGLDALVAALRTEDFRLRRAAIEGVSTLSAKLSTDIKESRSDLVEVLSRPALERGQPTDRQEEIMLGETRGAAAFALGVIGGDQSMGVLAMMLSDPYPEARYNAATGLARNGDPRAIPRLVEMLQVENSEAFRYEEQSGTLRTWKRNLVIVNGLRGVSALYSNHVDAPVDESLVAAITALADAKILTGNDALVLDEVQRLIQDTRS